MFKKALLASALAMACCSSFAATEFYVVVPLPGKASQLAGINVALNSYTLPEAVVGSPYAGFDFKTVLQVTGDAAYNGGLVSWKVVSGALPAGLTLNSNGMLSGTPTDASTSSFTLKATYKTKAGQQTYQIATLNITVGLASATLPAAKVGAAYATYDFKNKLTVNGDSNFSASNVSFTASGLPAGMTLSNTGILSGTPTTKNTSGASFNVVASYKTKSGQQAYTLVVNGVLLDVTQIMAGYNHTCAITTAGGAKCWGQNTYGQLGDNSVTQRWVPVDVVGLTSGVVSIASGTNHTCAVTTSGGAKCWGYNTDGILGNNSTNHSSVPVDVTGLTSGVTSISTGYSHTCAVVSGGAKCWGLNSAGQLGNNSTTTSLVPSDVSGLSSGVAVISAGYLHTCAVTTTGGAKCWGNNGSGELGNSSVTPSLVPVDVAGLTSGVAKISAGSQFTCAVTTSGGAKCWGVGSQGRLGNNNTAMRLVPVDVIGLTSGVASLVTGAYHACAVTTVGEAKCWGNNMYGQLGDNTTSNSSVPVAVVGLVSGVNVITGGQNHTCAMTIAGVKCWGLNSAGQLGDGTTTTRAIPTGVPNP